ncbi:5-formyltetrahydrofolate cyclo-ligase [Oligoflexia bacterium]|nr:5-formyltetrahydrofolate cyclo-ligase [Oligoflexia bacterium]
MTESERPELRHEMQKILASLDGRWLKAASNELCVNLSKLIDEVEYRTINRILAWTHFFPGEVDLSRFISEHLTTKEIYLPRSLPDRSMTFISVGQDWLETVETGVMGIPEPTMSSGEVYQMSAAEDTAVIVPGLGFDRNGNRVGRGKGYYDRFLGQNDMKGAVKIGVLWTLQLFDAVSVEEHDVPMNWICNEEDFFPTRIEL